MCPLPVGVLGVSRLARAMDGWNGQRLISLCCFILFLFLPLFIKKQSLCATILRRIAHLRDVKVVHVALDT
jgi:hypothetical protein